MVLYIRFLVGLVLLFFETASMAQTIEFPLQPAKFQETREVAGIGSYKLTQNLDLVNVEAFDLDERLLATCEAEWPENKKILTCEMAEGGLFRVTWHKTQADFEDLVTGENFSIYYERPPDKPEESGEPASRHGTWSFQSTKSRAEIERDWGKLTPIFANLMAEVEVTLGR